MNEQQPQSGNIHKMSNSKSMTDLVRDLLDDSRDMVTKEVALVRSEIARATNNAKKGVMSLATGGAVTYAGFLFLLLSATLGLAEVVNLWLSALIVGGVVLIIGLIMLQSGKKKLEPDAFKPEHTASTLRKDRDAVMGKKH